MNKLLESIGVAVVVALGIGALFLIIPIVSVACGYLGVIS